MDWETDFERYTAIYWGEPWHLRGPRRPLCSPGWPHEAPEPPEDAPGSTREEEEGS